MFFVPLLRGPLFFPIIFFLSTNPVKRDDKHLIAQQTHVVKTVLLPHAPSHTNHSLREKPMFMKT
jgi:hypothetical protein